MDPKVLRESFDRLTQIEEDNFYGHEVIDDHGDSWTLDYDAKDTAQEMGVLAKNGQTVATFSPQGYGVSNVQIANADALVEGLATLIIRG